MQGNDSFGYWVRRRRKALDWTQADLGRHVGASAAMIRKIEAGERRPSRELAELLAEHLGLSPDEREPFLRAARATLADGALPPPAEIPLVIPAGPLPPNNLPVPMTSMVNRVNDLAFVARRLLSDNTRLVTVLGPPGMGKTRLSIQVGEKVMPYFPDGVWFIDLSAVSDAALVLPAIALAIGLPLGSGKPPIEQLKGDLHHRKVLIILDNFEQVVEIAAGEVSALLRSCRGLKVLVTSRVRLDVYGEFEYQLPPMTLPPPAEQYAPDELLEYEATQLFIDRTKQHRPGFELNAGNAKAVAEICRTMDGLPLALELAAARTRRLPVEELAAMLRETSGRDWHSLLSAPYRDMPPRQQTLFNAVAWSYSLLPPEQQALLRQLSVFTGSFDWNAVTAVVRVSALPDEATLRDALGHLIDQNLVSELTPSPARWRLLEMIREFAQAQMADGERDAAAENHMNHFAARREDWYADWLDPAYLDTVEDDLDNFRAALRHALRTGNATAAHQLGASMGRFWERRGLLKEGRAMLASVMAIPGDVDPKTRFAVMHEATILAWMHHDFETAESLAFDALEWARSHQSPQAVVIVFNMLGRIYIEQERYDEADRVLSEAIELDAQSGPNNHGGMQYVQRGEIALARGDLDQAEALSQIGLDKVSESELIPWCLGWNTLAEVALARGDTDSAAHALSRVLPLAHLHSRRARIFLISVAGFILAEPLSPFHEPADALHLLGYVAATNNRLGDPLSPATQGHLSSRIDLSRARLPSDQWRAAWEQGWSMNQDTAMDIAQRVLPEKPPNRNETAGPAQAQASDRPPGPPAA